MNDLPSRGRAFAAALPVVVAVYAWYWFWLAANYCFGCSPDPSPLLQLVVYLVAPAMIVAAMLFAARLAGNPWPLAIVFTLGVNAIAVVPILIATVIAIEVVDMAALLLPPGIWLVVFVVVHGYWQVEVRGSVPPPAPGWRHARSADRLAIGAFVFLFLAELLYAGILPGETRSERGEREIYQQDEWATATTDARVSTPTATVDLRIATPSSSRMAVIDGEPATFGRASRGTAAEITFDGNASQVVALRIALAYGSDAGNGTDALRTHRDRLELWGPAARRLADLSPRLQVLPSEPIRLTLPDDGVYRLLYVRASADSPRLVLRLWSVDDIVVEAPVVDGPLTLTFTERNQVARIELEGQPGTEVRIAIGQPTDGAPEEWSQLLMLHPARGGQRQCDGRLMETPTACDLKFEGRGYLEIDSTTYFRQHPEATGAQLTLTFDWP